MRILLKASILFFAFCFAAFAQTEEKSSCPIINIYGPAEMVKLNELITYSVTVDAKGKNLRLQYIWSVSDGKIVEGQGTQNIKIEHPSDGGLTIAIEVKGFPTNCPNTASETLNYDLPPQAEKIDEFSQPFVRINKNRFNEIVRTIQNDPTAQLYIIFKHKEKTSPQTTNGKEKEISKSLVKAGLAADRITSVTGFGQTDSVEFFLVPAGATPPKIEDN